MFIMKSFPSNLDCFSLSQNRPEPSLDDYYIFDHRSIDIERYINNTREIKHYLITIKTLINKNEKQDIIDRYFNLLADSLNDFSNCSEFSCFINACDNVLQFVKNDIDLLKEITGRYLRNRTLNENVPEEWVQAILDSNSGRKKGSCGEIKLLDILANIGFSRVDNWSDFNQSHKCVARFSKIFGLNVVRQNLCVKIKTKKQDKRLDLIIKCEDKIFLLEAKHLNTSGGGQDKQIAELIELLSLSENNKNIFYIAFLDGNYSNILLGRGRAVGKLAAQRKDIAKFLKKNPNNYWVNTAGFNSLFR